MPGHIVCVRREMLCARMCGGEPAALTRATLRGRGKLRQAVGMFVSTALRHRGDESIATNAGHTTLRAVRAALADFRSSGKFIYSYAPYYAQGGYYLSSVADKVTLAPLGVVD